MRGLDALDRLFAETERDRLRDARWRARADRANVRVDRANHVLVRGFGVFGLVWWLALMIGFPGDWYSHGAALACMCVGVFGVRYGTNRRPVRRLPRPPRVSNGILERVVVVVVVVVAAVVGTVLR